MAGLRLLGHQVPPSRVLVWGYAFGGNANILEVFVKQLGQKLETGAEPRLIHTVR